MKDMSRLEASHVVDRILSCPNGLDSIFFELGKRLELKVVALSAINHPSTTDVQKFSELLQTLTSTTVYISAVQALYDAQKAPITNTPPVQKEWLPTQEAYRLLGFPSQEALRFWRIRRARAGVLKLGVHYKTDNPKSAKPHWFFHIERCLKLR